MKFFLFLSLFFLSFSLVSQTAPDVEGDLIASGPLVFQGKVAGHFRLTDNKQPEDLIYVYTITLLGNDLQPLGNKVYKSDIKLSFEDISYNGKYLGVMLKADGVGHKRYVDVIDGQGERISRDTLNYHMLKQESRGLFLKPQKEGFIYGMAYVQDYYIQFDLGLITSDGTTEAWNTTYKEKKTSLMPRVIASDNDKMLLAVQRITKSGTKYYQDVYCVGTKTGELIYKSEQDEGTSSAITEVPITAAFIGDEAVTIHNVPLKFKSKDTGLTLFHYDKEGQIVIQRSFFDREFFNEALLENGLPPLEKDENAKRVDVKVNGEGTITISYEISSKRDKKGKKVQGLEYRDAYMVVITPGFRAGPLIKLEKQHFILRNEATAGLQGNEVYKLRRRMKKGQYEKLGLKDLVSLHNGPYGFALSVNGTDFISNFFMDRDFTSEKVVYNGVRVVTCYGGEFEQDYIPFTENPDFISISRAKEGYLKLTEYKYGEGAVKIWLERLNY